MSSKYMFQKENLFDYKGKLRPYTLVVYLFSLTATTCGQDIASSNRGLNVQPTSYYANLPNQDHDWVNDDPNLKSVKFNLNTNTNDVIVDENSGMTRLHYAAMTNNISEINSLLNNNCSLINIRDKFGNTALHYAVAHLCSQAVHVLLSRGANKEISNNSNEGISGHTPLALAREIQIKITNTHDRKIDLELASINQIISFLEIDYSAYPEINQSFVTAPLIYERPIIVNNSTPIIETPWWLVAETGLLVLWTGWWHFWGFGGWWRGGFRGWHGFHNDFHNIHNGFHTTHNGFHNFGTRRR